MSESEDAQNFLQKLLGKKTLSSLYAARRYLPLDARDVLALLLKIPVYFKDPSTLIGAIGPLDESFRTPWEPGLRDGPTSSRFAVVDFDASSGKLHAAATWDGINRCFRSADDIPLDSTAQELFEFHQQSLWATAQATLDYFEGGNALGRDISWAFEGSRLILVPHAGLGKNAYYDRASKSLQFYWFMNTGRPIFTCLSSDIVNHELAHAILDGLRPHYLESVQREPAAFHEFVGDITALLRAFRNNKFRGHVLQRTKGNLRNDKLLSALAAEFGNALQRTPYLRSALNDETMESQRDNLEPHELSEVLTGAMFDILRGVFKKLRQVDAAAAKANNRKRSDATSFWQTYQRMQLLAIQPLDLLPPCDVTFRDYALAVLRHHLVSDPIDPLGIQAVMRSVFVMRGILTREEAERVGEKVPVYRRMSLSIFHDANRIAASRGSAYRFLDDNRTDLFIPLNADLNVAEIVRAQKSTLEGRLLPEQIILQYTWKEDVKLEGDAFGRFADKITVMLCGGTLVLDKDGNMVHWARKAGTTPIGSNSKALDELEAGNARKAALLEAIKARIRAGMIGETVGSEFGLLGKASPPFAVSEFGGEVSFQFVPHLNEDGDDDDQEGERRWQVSF